MIDNINTAAKAAGYYATNAGLLCRNRIFAVVMASDTDMELSIIKADETSFVCDKSRTFPQLGVGPLARAIAEKIVSQANMSTGLIPQGDQAMMASELRNHYALSAKVIDYIAAHPDKESLKMKTSFQCAPDQAIAVSLSIPEVKSMAAAYTRQYITAFSEFMAGVNVSLLDVEKIIVVGDTLIQDPVDKEFLSLGTNDVVFYPSSSLGDINAWTPPAPDDATTQFMVEEKPTPPPIPEFIKPEPPLPPPPPQPLKEFREIPKLNIPAVVHGTVVRIDTFDSTPGKGAAYQELEFLGAGLFRVVSCNRSLVPGDIVKPYDTVWNCSRQLDEEVTRGATPLGRFRTRVLVRISVKNCYEANLADMCR